MKNEQPRTWIIEDNVAKTTASDGSLIAVTRDDVSQTLNVLVEKEDVAVFVAIPLDVVTAVLRGVDG